MQITIRPATPEDAAAIAALHRASGASDPLLPDLLQGLDDDAPRVAWWAERLERPDSPTILVERGGVPVGFAAAGPALDPDTDDRCAELYAAWLLPEARVLAMDRSLLRAVPDALGRAGYRAAVAWVADDARGAYEGWRPAPATPLLPRPGIRLTMSISPLSCVAGFGRAVEVADFARAGHFLDPACVFETGRGELVGPAAVLAHYAEAAAAAQSLFDELAKESDADLVGGDRYRIRFTDRLRKGEHIHVYRFDQVFSVPEGRGITRIVHRERPGERARLDAFFRRAGVTSALPVRRR